MNFAQKIEEAEKKAQEEGHVSKGGDWFSFQEGDNTFRILEEPIMIFEKFKVGICYTECNYEGSAKFITRVLDRKDGEVKIAKLPYKIGTTIAAYQTDEDYSFEGFPMPYDIKVNAKEAGTKEVKYTVTPRAKREELSEEVMGILAKVKPIQSVVDKMKENKKKEHIEDGSFQKRKQEADSFKNEIKAEKEKLRNNPVSTEEPVIEYPTDEINPEDIPF